MPSEQDFSRDNQTSNIRYPHSGDLPQGQGGERPVEGAPEGPIDPVAEQLTPPDVVPTDLIEQVEALRSELEARKEKDAAQQVTTASRKKRNKIVGGIAAGVVVVGAGAFGIAQATSGHDDNNAAPAPSETSVAQLSEQPADQSGINQDSSTIAISSPTKTAENSQAPETPTSNEIPTDPELDPIFVVVNQLKEIDKSSAADALSILLNNELHAEETGNEDAYRAAFAQDYPNDYGSLNDIVNSGREKSRAFIAALANDSNYPKQLATVSKINSITQGPNGSNTVTIGATVEVKKVFPATQENGQLGPRIQNETDTAAYVLKQENVKNFSDDFPREIWVIQDILGYTTVVH